MKNWEIESNSRRSLQDRQMKLAENEQKIERNYGYLGLGLPDVIGGAIVTLAFAMVAKGASTEAVAAIGVIATLGGFLYWKKSSLSNDPSEPPSAD